MLWTGNTHIYLKHCHSTISKSMIGRYDMKASNARQFYKEIRSVILSRPTRPRGTSKVVLLLQIHVSCTCTQSAHMYMWQLYQRLHMVYVMVGLLHSTSSSAHQDSSLEMSQRTGLLKLEVKALKCLLTDSDPLETTRTHAELMGKGCTVCLLIRTTRVSMHVHVHDSWP